MKRTFCDRCGEEIDRINPVPSQFSDSVFTTIHVVAFFKKQGEADICLACHRDIVANGRAT